ncbi:Calcineurin-like phosphoesterase superfamily domain containing protein [Desulfosarcina cetonica]|uniref:metallophosphoesterase family protein n=1 Tax=Desulfosarcina cetonica TaxID=90730 RepID=UPI0006CFECA9|nr:metallophosphoesterase [Desulfosarcina cetonica]VTR65751.1 Calcineurin-like phosphoesterase superfamily domain containing protein [Desulfosarcina cetonica]
MKILSISDTMVAELSGRFDVRPFREVELVLSCGDLPPEYLAGVRQRLDVPLYYVRGNHDIRYHSTPPCGCLNLHQRCIPFKGLRIMGLEGSRWYNGGPIQYREFQMRQMIWRMLPNLWFRGGVDIVISHAPPRHINDAEDRCHRGFECFLKLIGRFKPRYFIHGHIHAHFSHPSQRQTLVGDTYVINTFGYHLLELAHGPSDGSD